MTVYLPVLHSHCTRVRFTVLMSCNDELAVHSCPLQMPAEAGCKIYEHIVLLLVLIA